MDFHTFSLSPPLLLLPREQLLLLLEEVQWTSFLRSDVISLFSPHVHKSEEREAKKRKKERKQLLEPAAAGRNFSASTRTPPRILFIQIPELARKEHQKGTQIMTAEVLSADEIDPTSFLCVVYLLYTLSFIVCSKTFFTLLCVC